MIEGLAEVRDHIRFELHVRPHHKGGEPMYDVVTRHGHAIGEVRWYPHWGQYVFLARRGVLLNSACLGLISDFMRAR